MPVSAPSQTAVRPQAAAILLRVSAPSRAERQLKAPTVASIAKLPSLAMAPHWRHETSEVRMLRGMQQEDGSQVVVKCHRALPSGVVPRPAAGPVCELQWVVQSDRSDGQCSGAAHCHQTRWNSDATVDLCSARSKYQRQGLLQFAWFPLRGWVVLDAREQSPILEMTLMTRSAFPPPAASYSCLPHRHRTS